MLSLEYFIVAIFLLHLDGLHHGAEGRHELVFHLSFLLLQLDTLLEDVVVELRGYNFVELYSCHQTVSFLDLIFGSSTSKLFAGVVLLQ